MAGTYYTKSGETWDMIAYAQMGSGFYMDQLIAANQKHCETFIFEAGVKLTIPEVQESGSSNVPPWFGN